MRESNSAAKPHAGVSLPMKLAAVSVLMVALVVATLPRVHAEGMHGGDMSGPGLMMFSGPPEHISHRVDHLLDGLNATDAQRSQIKQIAIGAAADLRTQADSERQAHQRGMQIFSAPVVDASAAESLRQQTLAQQDQASKRVLQAMLDVAKALTPEQRAMIGERLQHQQMIMQDRMRREHMAHLNHDQSSNERPTP